MSRPPDEAARASELSAHLEWPSDEDGDTEVAEDEAPTVRSFFLGQLPDDEPDDIWVDEPAGGENGAGDPVVDAADETSEFEGFELQVWSDRADPDEVLDHAAQHLDRLSASLTPDLRDPAPTHAGENEQPLISAADEPTIVATGAVPLAGGRRTTRAARTQRARGRRSRIVVVAAVVIALVAVTSLFVGTRGETGGQRARRPTSTSFERQTSSTGTTAPQPDVAPSTDPASEPATPGSVASGSRPGAPGTTAGAQAQAPVPAGSTAPRPPPAPGSTAAPPSSAAPPSAPPPRSPMCQLLPVVCP
jgi:hypothetical protein